MAKIRYRVVIKMEVLTDSPRAAALAAYAAIHYAERSALTCSVRNTDSGKITRVSLLEPEQPA